MMTKMMEEGARQMPGMMGSMVSHPMSTGAMMAAGGFAAGRGLLGGLARNPLVFLAAGVAAGFVLFKYQKEIVETAARLTGMGKDLVLHQQENLDDLIAETQTTQATPAAPAAPAQE